MQNESHSEKSVELAPAPQLRVRTNLRGGDLTSCQKAVSEWKKSYDKWYMKALDDGTLRVPKA